MNFRFFLFLIFSGIILLSGGCGSNNNPTAPIEDPAINSLSKNHGEIGSIINIYGKNFGGSQGSGYVEFTGAKATEISLWCDTAITVKVPVNAKTGKLLVNVNGKNSNQVDFTIDSVASSDPYIESISPSTFSPGAELTIIGRNFGAGKNASYIDFSGARPDEQTGYKSWSDIKIIVIIPSNITTNGQLYVFVNGISSNKVDYIVKGIPYINKITPDSARIGDVITINGNYFGDSQGSGYVNFAGFSGSNYSSWNNTQIKVTIPQNVTTCDIEVRVNGKKSNKVALKILPPIIPPPSIESITPQHAEAGDTVSINGQNFSEIKDSGYVTFNGTKAIAYLSWTTTLIKTIVPQGAVSGPVKVYSNGQLSNSVNFTIDQANTDPHIDYLDASSSSVGQTIGINGSNFGASRDSSFVDFNGTIPESTDYVSWSDTRILVKIPNGASSGPVKVVVNAVESNSENLTITVQNYIINCILIKSGSFSMGSSTIDADGPQHQAQITHDFYMGKYEVSQLEWKTVMDGEEPSKTKDDKNPVEQISWYKALEFCNRLSSMVGLTPCYTINGTNVTCNWDANGFRLPTEAEWEYACRAGTTGSYAGNIDDIGWTGDNSGYSVHNVGLKQPNGWGIYDIEGNVLEWCWDWYDPDYYKTRPNPDIDPEGPSSAAEKVVRGGSFKDPQANAASAHRDGRNPDFFDDNIGLRVVRKK